MAARFIQACPRRRQRRPLGLVGVGDVQDVVAFEVAAGGDAVMAHEARRVGAQPLAQLGLRPDEELPLLALGVGVGGRIETALRRGHLAQHVVQGLAQHAGEVGAPGDLERLGVGHGQQRVVVQHLFKVGHQPARVG